MNAAGQELQYNHFFFCVKLIFIIDAAIQADQQLNSFHHLNNLYILYFKPLASFRICHILHKKRADFRKSAFSLQRNTETKAFCTIAALIIFTIYIFSLETVQKLS